MKILILDPVHEILTSGLVQNGHELIQDFASSKADLDKSCQGIVVRSRLTIDKDFIAQFADLKFIARPGAGLENINVAFAESRGIRVFRSPEGNCQAVAEHALGLLLNLMNHMRRADAEVRQGIWLRKENRGEELSEKTVGLIGYGFMGKAFARVLSGIGCRVICYDIQPHVGDEFAAQVDWDEFKQQVDVVSLHVPLTSETHKMVNQAWLESFANPIFFLNTARGECVDTAALVHALNAGRVLGAGLDVLEFEAKTFEQADLLQNPVFKSLAEHPQVLLTPHIAGWTHASNRKMSAVILEKILKEFGAEGTF